MTSIQGVFPHQMKSELVTIVPDVMGERFDGDLEQVLKLFDANAYRMKMSASQSLQMLSPTSTTEFSKFGEHMLALPTDVRHMEPMMGSLRETVLEIPVGNSKWDSAVVNRVLWMVNNNVKGAEIRLNPPQLGPLEVRISVDGEQTSVSFTAHHQAVRESLENALPRLRDMFVGTGLDLANVDVSQHNLAQHYRDHLAGYQSTHQLDVDRDDSGTRSKEERSATIVSGLVDYFV